MNRSVSAIAARLSLRTPQRESLEILHDVLDVLELQDSPASSLQEQMERVKALYPSVTDFERDFPSLCFALATGVGKTRLMGAFIAYLHLEKGVRNFFVLAPNLTIYNKLIQDFTPHTPKYVFKGIAEFVTKKPVIITGENYESGNVVMTSNLFGDDEIHINIFNISKINAEVRGGKAPKIKRLSEYIGESYFEYLASLPDLILLMDESHRYRASAGIRVLNELKPVLGIELTATPQTEANGRQNPFKNVIYSYSLHTAMSDGYVKEPAVATRENFKPSDFSEVELERIKLEDGIRVHEETKVELEVYARQNNLPIVKPFVLVVAQDTDHAEHLLSIMRADDFFDGKYKDKVITVHSNQRGEEKDETIQQLMSLEDPSNDTEIVIHVNMLKEGWDVTNLYTIVPLRAANSRTLVEQSIGRGLRLPYGKRTGVKAVDRLTIVAHDRFQEIVNEANNPKSVIRAGVVIGRDVTKERTKAVTVHSKFDEVVHDLGNDHPHIEGKISNSKTTVVDGALIQLVKEKIRKFEHLPTSSELNRSHVKQLIVSEVKSEYTPGSGLDLFPEDRESLIEETVQKVVDIYIQLSIDLPRIVVQPVGELAWGFDDFDLNCSSITLQPVADNILIQHLRTHERDILQRRGSSVDEENLEDYVVASLIDFDTISYDDHAELLYKLSGQLVSHLQSYLKHEDDVRNVLQYNRRRLAELIYAQMKEHYFERATTYEVTVSRGFETLKPAHYAAGLDEGVHNFREPVIDKSRIRSMVFGGFLRCLYPIQKFDSDSERKFAVICESDSTIEKWFKPTPGQLRIYYNHTSVYNPDFVVESQSEKYICEIKRESEMEDKTVLDKARAVRDWCQYATEHEMKHGGKPWVYLLIPHTDVDENMTLGALKSKYQVQAL